MLQNMIMTPTGQEYLSLKTTSYCLKDVTVRYRRINTCEVEKKFLTLEEKEET